MSQKIFDEKYAGTFILVDDVDNKKLKEAISLLNKSGVLEKLDEKKIRTVGIGILDMYVAFHEMMDLIADKGLDDDVPKETIFFYNSLFLDEQGKDEPEPKKEEDTGEEDTGEEDTGEEDTGEEDTGEEDTGEEDTGEEDKITWDDFAEMSLEDLQTFCEENELITDGTDLELEDFQREVAIEFGIEPPEKEEKPKRARGRRKTVKKEDPPKKEKEKDGKKEEKPKKEKKKAAPKKEPKPRSCYGHIADALSGQLDQVLQKGATFKDIMEKLDVKRARITSHLKALENKGLTVLEKPNDDDKNLTFISIDEENIDQVKKTEDK